MGGSCCTGCAKYLLCVLNFFFFIVGAVLFSVGTWLLADRNSFFKLARLDGFLTNKQELPSSGTLDHVAYILLAIGAFVFIISFLGYCGALLENRVFLSSYGIFLIIVLLLQITSIVLLIVYREQAEKQSRDFLEHSIANYYRGGSERDVVSLSWEVAMVGLQCCGVNNYTDFSKARHFRAGAGGQQVPASCCILQGSPSLLQPADENCPFSPDPSNSYYRKGCYNKLLTLLRENINLVVGLLLGLAVMQFIAITFAFCVCRAVAVETEYEYYK